MASILTALLAPVGSTGNNTHASTTVPESADVLAVEFEITAIGAGPTVTFKLEGSLDDDSVAAVDSDWFDLAMLPSVSSVELVTDTQTTVDAFAYFIDTRRRFARKVRLVTSLNTNVTYQAQLVARLD
jgi:hypothetical protein